MTAGALIVTFLAACGLMSVVWALLGWLLPGCRGWVLVCWGTPEEGTVLRTAWLRSLGLLNCPLVIVSEEAETSWPDAEICCREELLARLELERSTFNGTGNGDHPGRHQRRGVSEL